jgi:hypothetical protein
MIGPYLYEKITDKPHEFTEDVNKHPHYMICGSILREATNRSVVLGCGFGEYDQKPEGKPKIHLVRGKLTEQRLFELGYTKTWGLGDPGLFLPFVYRPEVEKVHEVSVLPHYIDYEKVKAFNLDWPVLNITQPVETVINEINQCKKIITSSLHGLIVAHAYGIPAQWVEFSDNVVGKGFKFRDYFTTVGFTQTPIDCRSGISKDLVIPDQTVEVEKFRGAFEVLRKRLK